MLTKSVLVLTKWKRVLTKWKLELTLAVRVFPQTNFVRFHNDRMFFYAGCASTADVTDGLVYNRAPLLGPLLYIGPSGTRTRATDNSGTRMFGGQKWCK